MIFHPNAKHQTVSQHFSQHFKNIIMKLFGKKSEPTNQNVENQKAEKILLEKEYDFMYESFILSSQRTLYLLLEENNGIIEALKFEFLIYKFGYPNDEVGLPSKIPGVEIYGFSQVQNSEWIKELIINNRSHSRHSDSHFANYKHYIVRLKDVTLEVISKNYAVEKMTVEKFNEIVETELSYIKNVG